jgi:hypothetical protein
MFETTKCRTVGDRIYIALNWVALTVLVAALAGGLYSLWIAP